MKLANDPARALPFSIVHIPLALGLLAPTLPAQVYLSEVIDGTLLGGQPKLVEITNASGVAADLSGFSLGIYSGGSTNLAGLTSQVLSGIVPPGETYLIAFEPSAAPGTTTYFNAYGCDPDSFQGFLAFNGDDVIALFLADGMGVSGAASGNGSDATLHDVYGVIGIDGTGEPWEYLDSYAQRTASTPSATFNAAEWNIAGPNALEAGCGNDDVCELANLMMLTTPTPTGGCGGTPNFVDACSGDGGDQNGCTNCPCSNNAAIGTVGGCINGTGQSARLLPSGSPSVSGDTMRFEISGGNPSTFAILSSGNELAPQNAMNPCFGLGSGILSANFDGLRCAVQIIQRHGTRPTDLNGAVGVTTNGWGPPNGPTGGLIAQGGFVAGQTRQYQVIYRENPALSCMTGQNTTQAVTTTFLP